MGRFLTRSFEASDRLRGLLLGVMLLYAGSFAVGFWMSSAQLPITVEFKETVMEAVATERPFTTVTEALEADNPFLAIALTFVTNLAIGAFASTTLPGVIPLLGGMGSLVITVFRGWTVGVLYTEVFRVSPAATALSLGTLILEFGAYVLSGAVGIDISLAPVFPERYGVDSRWDAFKSAWKNAAGVYVMVVILLALGALWEIGGLFLLMG
ncbi:MAG: stage II sporulation protein M [Candidatus Bathyarchaeia archaeon]